MKEYLVKNNFVEIWIDFEKAMVHQKYFESTKTMSGKDFKEIIETYVNKLVSFYQSGKISANSLKILVDDRQFWLNINPSLEEWIDNKISQHLLKMINKMAFLKPEKYYKGIDKDLRQAEKQALNLDTNYFASEQMALLWLQA